METWILCKDEQLWRGKICLLRFSSKFPCCSLCLRPLALPLRSSRGVQLQGPCNRPEQRKACLNPPPTPLPQGEQPLSLRPRWQPGLRRTVGATDSSRTVHGTGHNSQPANWTPRTELRRSPMNSNLPFLFFFFLI